MKRIMINTCRGVVISNINILIPFPKIRIFRRNNLIIPSRNYNNNNTHTRCLGTLIRSHTMSQINTAKGPNHAYESMIEGGSVKRDPKQVEVLKVLDSTFDKFLQHYIKSGSSVISSDVMEEMESKRKAVQSQSKSFFSSFVSSAKDVTQGAKDYYNSSKAKAPPGVYLYGSPGCGKSFLMDTFYDCFPNRMKKRRVHFNSFMLDVHKRIHAWRSKKGSGDPIEPLARELSSEALLLCFDEFQVTDVAGILSLSIFL